MRKVEVINAGQGGMDLKGICLLLIRQPHKYRKFHFNFW